MKRLCSTFVAGLLLFWVGLSPAKEVKYPVQSHPEQAGASIVEALKSRDVTTLTAFVTTSGITVGADGPTIPLARFRRELLQKRGVYCVLMDASCIENNGKNSEDDSLRGLILRQPIKLDVHLVEGAPKVIEVVVRNASNPHKVLFSLFLKSNHGSWKLESIEYD